jgi:ABC-type dipeptide/oligopeptide/nickel transport system permease component
VSLIGFIIRRLGASVLAVLGVCLLVFLLLHIVPGDPVDNLAGGEATEDQRRSIERCMNLDKPLPKQFLLFLGTIADGSLGRQCPQSDRTVAQRIGAVFPYTLELAVGGILVALVLALPLGIIAAVRRGTYLDAAASTISLLGISVPTMWMGPIVIYLFYVQLGWFPGPAEIDRPFALFLPSVVIGTHLMAMLSRMTRSSLLDVLREDYMQTARAKGLAPTVVVVKHGLRNALLPVITIVGMQFGGLLAGSTIVETVFARPGLGSLIYEAIRQRNYPVIQGCVLVIAVITVTMQLLVDVAYGLADPRIRRA